MIIGAARPPPFNNSNDMAKKRTEENQGNIEQLKFDDKNFNKHTEYGMGLLEKSLRENGAGRSVLVDKDDNIIAGNGIVEAAQKAGIVKTRIVEVTGDELVVVKRTDLELDSKKGRQMAFADNATAAADLSWDEERIGEAADEWGLVPEDWGVELPEAADGNGGGASEDEFDESEVSEAVCKRGEVWKLGEHRLMCGDSTNADDIDKLIDGDFIRLVVTSPPYGVGKDYEEQGVGPWLVTIKGVINAIKGKVLIICWNIVDLFCTGTQFTEPTGAYSIEMMSAAGYGMLYNRIWKKPGGNFAGNNPYYTVTTKPVQDYEYLYAFAEKNADRHIEPIKKYLFEEAKKASLTNDIISNAGGPAFMYGHWFTNHQWSLIDEKNYKLLQEYCISQGIDAFKREYCSLHDEYLRKTIYSKNLPKEEFSEWGLYGVWEFNTVHERLGGHAAAFPLELPVRYIKIHSYEGDTVLDPFGGTGTTLIAAEQLGRKCRMMELDPHYCDVIIARWEKLTGQKAERIDYGIR